MTSTARDLQTYHLARLLHLVPHLHRVYAENCFLIPLFFSSVSPGAKQLARLILLCLQREFGDRGSTDIYLNILSFLSFPELVTAPTASVVADARTAPGTQSSDEKSDNITARDASVQFSTAGSRKRQRPEGAEEVGEEGSERLASGQAAKFPEALAQPSRDASAQSEKGAATSSSPVSGAEATIMGSPEEGVSASIPLFLVRPPALSAHVSMTQLYVRMTSEYQLNEETMNTYFGRYGQVSCTQVHERQVTDGRRSGGVSHVQDFIVTVDSMHNALQAVYHAYYQELTFIALHDPEHNRFTLTDADRVLSGISVEIFEELPQTVDSMGEAGSSSHQSFIPDVVVDGLPYWLTVDQLRACFSEYGTVMDLRTSIDDRSGAFTGAALLRMSSVEEAIAASEGLNGTTLKGCPLVSGVLDAHLNVVSLRRGTVIRRADEMLPEDYDLTENGRRWV
uniref:Uncharacterized protein TCIL3000_11_16510 n=1 Tax=Trypanosoma congolense (strain IL3000) TaxID=1068625 RepID=G0V3B6_TRYCI|nr:unnamed protein product [Trypanosoma congolense IL3000]